MFDEDISDTTKMGILIVFTTFITVIFITAVFLLMTNVKEVEEKLINDVECVIKYPPFDGIAVMEDGTLAYADEVPDNNISIFNIFLALGLIVILMFIFGKVVSYAVHTLHSHVLENKYLNTKEDICENDVEEDKFSYIDDDSRYDWVEELLSRESTDN